MLIDPFIDEILTKAYREALNLQAPDIQHTLKQQLQTAVNKYTE
jgi:hypothetical protein